MAILSYRSLALWILAIPRPRSQTLSTRSSDAREIGHAATLMYALTSRVLAQIYCGNYASSKRACSMKLVALADEKGASFWKAHRNDAPEVALLALTGKAADAVQMITSGISRISVNGSDVVDAVVLIIFGESLCGTRPIR